MNTLLAHAPALVQSPRKRARPVLDESYLNDLHGLRGKTVQMRSALSTPRRSSEQSYCSWQLMLAIGMFGVGAAFAIYYLVSHMSHTGADTVSRDTVIVHHKPPEHWKLKLNDLNNLDKTRAQAKQLDHIKSMYQQGLLDESEYSAAKKLAQLGKMRREGLLSNSEFTSAKAMLRPKPPSDNELASDLDKMMNTPGNLEKLHKQGLLTDLEYASAVQLAASTKALRIAQGIA
jgi:uncharacterized protein YqgQ